MRIGLPLVAFTLFCLAMPVSAQAGPVERALIAHINDFRAANHVSPLRLSRSLARSSKRFARGMMARDRFGHASRIQASSRYRSKGEVIAKRRGWQARTAAVLAQWSQSPGHRMALLSPRFREIGVGRSRGRFGPHRTAIWVAQLGRR